MPVPETYQWPLRLNEDLRRVVSWERDGDPVELTAGTLTFRETEDSADAFLTVEGTVVDGTIVLYAAAATLLALENVPDTGVYDLVVTDVDDNVTRVLEGPVVTSLGVTRG